MALSPLPVSAVAKQVSYHDISIENEYDPPLEDKTWYLLSPGILSRNKTRLFGLMEDRFKDAGPEYDVSDYPCYSAPTFKSIVAFLPQCPHLKGQFERKPNSQMQQTKGIYFVIHGIHAVLFNPIYALRLTEFYNAPFAVILAVANYHEAQQIAAAYPPLSAAALEYMAAVKKQAREALRESVSVSPVM